MTVENRPPMPGIAPPGFREGSDWNASARSPSRNRTVPPGRRIVVADVVRPRRAGWLPGRAAGRRGRAEHDRHDDREAVRAAVAEHAVAQGAGAPGGALDVDARPGAVARRGLGRRRVGPRRALDLGRPRAIEAGPHRDALDVDVDG